MQSSVTKVDVLLVGGGPAGTACALELCRDGRRVAILERHSYDQTRVGETLPPAIRKPLTRLGVWEQFVSAGHLPSYGISSAWGGPSLYENDMIFNPYGNGWHVDRNRFDGMLAEAAQARGAIIYKGARLVSCAHVDGGQWSAEIVCGSRRLDVRAPFLVDATGRASSPARKACGAKRKVADRLIGIVNFLSPVSPVTLSPPFTLIEAARDGWWYSAPLPDTRLVVAYMTDADLYARESRRAADYWQESLLRTEHTRSRTNSYARHSRQYVFNACSSRLMKAAGQSWLAVGDAAMSFDPLSSQGIYQALSTGLDAAHVVLDRLNNRATSLQEYARRLEMVFENYLRERKKYYGAEKRWPDSIFWQRRQ